MMLRVGITGGIGSGKTTVCKIFESMGIPVYYADKRAKYLMSYNWELKLKIKSILGKDAYHRNGRLNRQYVASKIFNDPKLLNKVNSLVHPAVHEDAMAWFKSLRGIPYALYEAALLVENGSFRNLDNLIVVSAPKELRIKRVVKRDKTSKEEVIKRINNQLPESKKIEVADHVIINDETHSIIESVVKVHRNLLKEIDGEI